MSQKQVIFVEFINTTNNIRRDYDNEKEQGR